MNLKQVAILGSAALLLGLIGCGKEESSGSSSDSDSGSSALPGSRSYSPRLSDADDAKALAVSGSRLVKAIISESLTGIEIFPHNDENDGLDPSNTGMINSRTYSTSTDYWKALFDIEHQTSADWAPLIDRENLPCVWGEVRPPAKAGELQPNNNAWIVVSGLSLSNSSCNMPVLVSWNVKTDQFILCGEVRASEMNSLVKIDGDYAVVVWMDGSSRVLKAKNQMIRLAEFYKSSDVHVPEGTTLRYLAP